MAIAIVATAPAVGAAAGLGLEVPLGNGGNCDDRRIGCGWVGGGFAGHDMAPCPIWRWGQAGGEVILGHPRCRRNRGPIAIMFMQGYDGTLPRRLVTTNHPGGLH